jgi:hypothetical protein
VVARGSAETYNKRETFNPWSVVNLVFDHLVASGLHPVLGETGDPSPPATDLLRALGVEPGPEPPAHTQTDVSQQLAELQAAVLGDRPRDDPRDDLRLGEAADDATQNLGTQNLATQNLATQNLATQNPKRSFGPSTEEGDP